MTRTHTPGPWQVAEYSTFWSVKIGSDTIASDISKEADAQLIAAAPDLFHELDAIAAALEAGDTVTIEPGSVKAASIAAAIAKATGKA